MNNEENYDDYLSFRLMNMAFDKQRNDEYIERMRPIWRKAGEKLRKLREGLCISRREVAKTIGAADSVLMRLETGGAVQRRPVIEQSYRMAIELIQYRRREAAGLI